MTKKKYNETFSKGIITLLVCLLAFGSLLAYSIIAELQYQHLIQHMLITNATVTDTDDRYSRFSGYHQDIQISYEIDGQIYHRELATDTPISFEPGHNTYFQIGDRLDIFYNPEDPTQIATELSSEHGALKMIFYAISVLLVLLALVIMILGRKQYLVKKKKNRTP